MENLDRYSPNYENIDALHNFYPRIGTGISVECMINKNKLLKEKTITPKDLVIEAFERVEQNKDLNSFITLNKEEAIKQVLKNKIQNV